MVHGRAFELDVTTVFEVDLSTLPDVTAEQLAAVARAVLAAEGARGPWEIAFVLVDDVRLQALHRQFMGIDEPTDVMTFERTPEDGEPGSPAEGGDIIISVDRAFDQAPGSDQSPAREVMFLAAHGVLHLTGWVDHTDEERAAMLDRGETILRRLEGDRGGET